jgi:hypothetical protein
VVGAELTQRLREQQGYALVRLAVGAAQLLLQRSEEQPPPRARSVDFAAAFLWLPRLCCLAAWNVGEVSSPIAAGGGETPDYVALAARRVDGRVRSPNTENADDEQRVRRRRRSARCIRCAVALCSLRNSFRNCRLYRVARAASGDWPHLGQGRRQQRSGKTPPLKPQHAQGHGKYSMSFTVVMSSPTSL